MAVRIRMTRTGRLNRPFFRIGVYDSRTRRDGRIIEQLGFYDPLLSTGGDSPWKLDRERLEFWMKRGAKPSETITAYLRDQKVAFKDAKAHRSANKQHSTDRKASRRKTGRTVEATAQSQLPKKPGGKPAAKPAPKAKPKKEEPAS